MKAKIEVPSSPIPATCGRQTNQGREDQNYSLSEPVNAQASILLEDFEEIPQKGSMMLVLVICEEGEVVEFRVWTSFWRSIRRVFLSYSSAGGVFILKVGVVPATGRAPD